MLNTSPMHAAMIELGHARKSADWKRWQTLTAKAPPFLAPEFFTLVARFEPDEAVVAEAWESDALIGALPLARHGDRISNLRCDFTPGYDYYGAPAGIESIWKELRADPSWAELELGKIPCDSVLATRLPGLATADGYPVAFRIDARQPYFTLPGFEAALSPKFHTNLVRCARKAGGVELERIPVPDRAAFDEALALEAMAWKGLAGTAIDSDAQAAQFYRTLSRLVGRRGAGALYFLRAQGRRIAMMFAVEDAHTVYALKIGYDPAAANLSPGHLLVWKVAADAEARGLAELNFVGREDGWKRKWTELAHERVAMTIYRPNRIGLARYAKRHLIRPRLPENLRGGIKDVLPRHCQREDLIGVHSLLAKVHGRLTSGLGIKSGIRRMVNPPPPRDPLGEPSQFAPGSWVRVKPADQLRGALDDRDRTRGLAFVPTQWETVDQVYRVASHVRRLRDDHGVFRPVGRTVLLDGVDCAGHGPEPAGCGRHCPMMYRDEWLEPAPAPTRGPTPPATAHTAHARVRSFEEIREGLDLQGRRDGLTFMPEMAELAGKRFAVVNKLTQVFELDRWVETRAPIYLLEDVHCHGTVTGKRGPCDRACSMLWHADWLVLEP